MKKLNDKELLELLKTDVKSFNGYRTQFHEQKIDFSGADLGGADLWGVNLKGANLEGANISGINLGGANFTGANLRWAKITLTKENIEAIKGAIL